jgi:hypothetical protein
VNIDKRKSHRYAVSGLRREGELRFGKVRLPVLLLDQSAGGFTAISWRPPDVEVNSAGLLRIGEDWHEIRLINVMPVAPPESEDAAELEVSGQCFRLGLYRLGDAYDPDKKEASWAWATFKDHLNNVMPSRSPTVFFGVFFLVAAVVLPIAAILLMKNCDGNSIGNEVGLIRNIATATKHGVNDPNWEKMSSGQQSDASTSLDSGEDSASPGVPARQKEGTGHVIYRDSGAAVFLLPQVVRQLGITEEQKRQLRQIAAAASEIIVNLEDQLNGAINPEQYQELQNMAHNNALQFLTEEQRSKWKIISGESAQNKSVSPVKDDK